MMNEMHLVEGAGLGVMISTWWLSVMVAWIIGIAGFIGVLSIGMKLSGNAKINPSLRIALKVLCIALLVYPLILLTKDTIEAFQWGFLILAFGQLVTSLALLMGILEISIMKPTT
jgi:hypothetical protein